MLDIDVDPVGILKRRFGYPSFRSTQKQIIDRTLAGGDSLVIMPTGGGKSLCFQIPALVIADRYARHKKPELPPPLTLVLSPLIALMKDQVDALQAKGIEATFVNSSLDRTERLRRYEQLAKGHYSMLYVTPERFRKEEFVTVLNQRKVPLLAVDEAHCISEWGHDFRPDYTRVGDFRKELGNPTTIALTATATRDVQLDIIKQLGIAQFGKALGQCQLFHEGIQRPNLTLKVREVWGLDEKIVLVNESLERWGRSSGIVYFTLIRSLEEMSERLRKLQVEHVCYHGKIDDAFKMALCAADALWCWQRTRLEWGSTRKTFDTCCTRKCLARWNPTTKRSGERDAMVNLPSVRLYTTNEI
jgi:ATP-dependent DNA helicase RecQ